MCLDYSSCY